MRPLDGVFVLDLSRVLSGPHCGRMLADLGAEVVKVEPPEGDLTRFSWPRLHSMATYYAQQNIGKRNISLDLKHPAGVALVRALAVKADVVLENFRPGVMDRMGLGYREIAGANPRVVYCSISGYGQTGPWVRRRAYAPVVQAETGITHGQGTARGGVFANDRYSHADVYTSLEAASAILAALYQRERTGAGQHIDVSMAETMLYVNEHLHYDLSGLEDPGEELPSFAPGDYPVLATGEGHAIVISGHPAAKGNFERFVRVLGKPELLDDPRFATVALRRRHYDELLDELRVWALGFDDLEAIEEALAAEGFAMGVLRTAAELAATEWAAARRAVVEVSDRGGGVIRIPNAPWHFSGAEVGIAEGAVPAYRGEHNRAVLAEHLGLSDAELDRLEAEGVLSARVPRR